MSPRKPTGRPVISLLDVLTASPTEPIPRALRQSQLTGMLLALAQVESGASPSTRDWACLCDAVNLCDTLALTGAAQDDHGHILTAMQALGDAWERHQKHSQPMRLAGEGLDACRAAVRTWCEAVDTLPARTIMQAQRTTINRVHALANTPATPGAVIVRPQLLRGEA